MKMRWLIVMLTACICALTGCRSAEVVADSQLSGVYTAGLIHHGDGEIGYLRPYLEVDLSAGKLTVEESGETIWSSPCRRDGDRLLISEPKSAFPEELSIGRGETAESSPVLRARSGTFFHRVTTTYTRRENFPRRVGKPIPPEIEVKLARKVELTDAQRRLLNNVTVATFPGLRYDFSRIEQTAPDGTVVTTLDVSGKVITVERDPARPLLFSLELKRANNFKICDGNDTYQIYLCSDPLDDGEKK